jgi:ABC-2 type transport system permease protein
MSSMGATLADVQHEYYGLWIQTVVYFLVSCTIYQVRGRYIYK